MRPDLAEANDLTRIVAIVVFFIVMIFGVILAVRVTRRRDIELETERQAKIRELAATGAVDEYGQNVCVICGAPATRLTVRTGRPWFDSIPLLATLNRLWGMPWKYAIVDDRELGGRLCSSHRRSAEAKLERIHSSWRSRHAEFNAAIQEEALMLDQGGLEQILREEQTKIKSIYVIRQRLDSVSPALLKEHVGDEHEEVHL